MRSSDRSSTHDSVLKVETRTATGSDLSPSEDDDYSSHDDWDTDTPAVNARRHDHFRYSAEEYGEPVFPPKVSAARIVMAFMRTNQYCIWRSGLA